MATFSGIGTASSPIEMQPTSTSPMNSNTGDEHQNREPADRLTAPATVPKNLALLLYTSHFLSTWNSRLFEFASVLFLAMIFPNTLLPMSVYALVRSGAAILFSQPVGSWIDHGDRLTVVRVSIVGQRVAVALSCGLFWALEERKSDMTESVQKALFALTVVLACVEKLSSVMNLVSVERDWVVVITEGNENARRDLNARMRRIDLLCKLLGPLAISTIAMVSTVVAILATLGMNLAAVALEYIFIAKVYAMVPRLKRNESGPAETATSEGAEDPAEPPSHSRRLRNGLTVTASHFLPVSSLPFYLKHPAFLPSFSLALLYLTVLSFSGQMITYLISVGYSSLYVGIARTVSTVCELSATWIAPRLMRRIGEVRGGIWSLTWQMGWLAAAVAWFFSDVGHNWSRHNLISATGLAVGVALSRVGLWGFDLCAQSIVQDEVEMGYRGTFSAVETLFQNLFELISYATTIVFSRPDQFQWPVIISIAAVYVSGGLYSVFVRKRRGHLFHTPKSRCFCVKLEEASRQEV
ncbi:Ferroporti-1 [Apodospora peruviana]|uniref:Solute carrier family 40 member n=1 Tax=Apodospora peruviana TaxID=516989 RepID=A0AAE0M035_9PEZI|nr:Ferroporti-1 [Apodospora peruviana]